MPQIIAIDWEIREVRVVAGSLRGKRLRVEQAFRAAWPGQGLFDTAATAERGAVLQAALRERGIGRGDVLVTIGRSCVELKQLTLPPAPDDELPDMVRFAAQREFHAAGADAALDFLPAPESVGEARSVLAATIDAAALDYIRNVCDAAGMRLRRVLLRPCAAASALAPNVSADAPPRLLVDAAAEETELTALAGAQIVLLRSTRMPGDHKSAEYARALTAEIRRTVAAVQNQLAGRRVEQITLCGSRAEIAAPAERLAAELGVAVDVVDPWAAPPESIEMTIAAPDDSARFAPLLGALADEAEGIAPKFDFLNPRRPPVPPNRRLQMLAGALAATVLFAIAFAAVQWKLRTLDGEIAAAKRQAATLEKQVKEADDFARRAGEVDRWTRSDVSWLAELARLSERSPDSKKIMLTQLRSVARPQGGGELHLDGLASDSASAAEVEADLRDAGHEVVGKSRERDDENKSYPWKFRTDVTVKGEPSAVASPSASPPANAGRGGR